MHDQPPSPTRRRDQDLGEDGVARQVPLNLGVGHQVDETMSVGSISTPALARRCTFQAGRPASTWQSVHNGRSPLPARAAPPKVDPPPMCDRNALSSHVTGMD